MRILSLLCTLISFTAFSQVIIEDGIYSEDHQYIVQSVDTLQTKFTWILSKDQKMISLKAEGIQGVFEYDILKCSQHGEGFYEFIVLDDKRHILHLRIVEEYEISTLINYDEMLYTTATGNLKFVRE